MGCDGGTIPRRNELVKVKKKPETRDQTSHLNFQWRYCNLTQQLLHHPIVTCGLGKLYNKSSIIEALINKKQPAHIKTLKDVLDLKLSRNPEFNEDGTDQIEVSPYICPITNLEMSGIFKFVALWTCGCVFSERALKEINTKSCPTCQTDFEDCDVVVLNCEESDLELMVKRMELRKKRKKKCKENVDRKRVKVE